VTATGLKNRPIRVVVGKVGLDGHDRGAKVITRGFRDAGMEVIYTGLRRSPDELADIVLQEDADVLGLSILSSAAIPLSRRVIEALRSRDLTDSTVVLVGGILGPEISEELKAIGVDAVFGPGSSMTKIIRATNAALVEKGRLGPGQEGA
jgi:methylmalonyl-CoA mutase C-terminal domain/subunit